MVHTNRKIFRHNSPALGASLTCTSWVHGYNCPASVFSFVGQKQYQCSPGSIRDAFAKFLLLKHFFNIKVFMCDYVITINKFICSLMAEIFSLVSNAFMHQSYRMLVVTSLCFRKSSLNLSKRFLPLLEKCWFINFRPIRALHIRLKPKVDANNFSRFWEWFWAWYITREIHIPFVGSCSFDCTGFYSAFNWSMKNDLHSINLGKINRPIRMESKSRLWVGDRVVPAFSLESWVPRILTRFATSKKSLKSKVYSKLGVLECLREYIIKFGFLRLPFNEFFVCFIKGYRFLFGLPSILSKRDGLVIHQTGEFQDFIHLGRLELSWI